MEGNQSVRTWIEDLPKRGRITFSIDDVEREFMNMAKETIQSSIYRLVKKGRVCSVWRNYYVVVPDEYALRGFVPPIEYIDSLMRRLSHRYYVGLLSAAALHGSSHQQPQSFMVATDSDNIKSKLGKNVDLRFFVKSHMCDDNLQRKSASYGEVMVSDPLMTALDLVLYENRIGGLERAAEVIDGLVEELDIASSNPALWASFPTPVIQRFGYIVELILGYTELGDAVNQIIRGMGNGFRKSLLDPRAKSINIDEYPYNPRWKIIANIDLEMD
ncbi:MAG: type IV toxin-antitoxin system AbiEi family antitoxin [Clostridiales bacterium]|nr:type IV toxin-antitoxin system AbiEi family antitoxin [Clostridiales bacterium]